MRFPISYCVFDTETTGLDTSTCEVIELAVKKVERGFTEIEKSWLIKPASWSKNPHLPEKITEITGITDAMIETDGISEETAWNEFFEIICLLPLIGHNIARYDLAIFDRYLEKYPRKVNMSPSIFYKPGVLWVDTAAMFKAGKMGPMDRRQFFYENHMDWARRILDTKVLGLKYNLTIACQELGIDVSDLKAHRATDDVEMCDRIYRKLTLNQL